MWRLLFLCLLTPISLQAASVRIVPDSLPIYVGTPVTFSVFADTEDVVVNAMEASLHYDESSLNFTDAFDAESRILFWVRYPQVCDKGVICFSGIAPGGFSGNSQNIASFTYVPMQTGTTTISLSEIRLLRHDGKGTDVPVLDESIQIFVKESLGGAVTADSVLDTEPPEVFTPHIISDPQVHDGRFSVVFDTKDKQTKVASYHVKEYKNKLFAWFSKWYEAESPYEVRDQTLHSIIEVKATDVAGNERIMTIPARNEYAYMPFISTLLGVLFGILLLYLVLRLKNNIRYR